MHHLRSRQSVTRFKLVSWLLCLMWLGIVATFGIFIYSLLAKDKQLASLTLWMILSSLLLGILQWVLSSRPHCPLCLTPPIAHRACSKHRNAKQLFGSYRLRVACSIILRKCFCCPYCGETTAVEAPPAAARHRKRC
jgi:hypothetical protein